ncbi:MAG: hypothetical protein ACE5GG_05020 [Candidatus Omnitrophota bacterium]
MKYGHFSSDGTEFIITRPDTPRPWINYLTNERYCAITSQCAGGYSFHRDCRSGRVLRWAPENWRFDRPGRYIYVRETKDQRPKTKDRIWSLTYQPIRNRPEFFRARHGLGYTVIETKYCGISSEVTYFVPGEDECELWLVKITNTTPAPRILEIYPYAEWLLGDYHEELRYRNIMNLYNRVWYDEAAEAIFARKTAFWQNMNIRPFQYLAFCACSLPVKEAWARKDEFLGRYNTEERPQVLFSNLRTPNSKLRTCSGEDGIACFKHAVNLAPGQSQEFVVVLGQAAPARARRLA